MGQCQDCDRCTASAISRLGRGLAAVGTLGVTELAIGVGDAFKRSCPTCKHPLGMHAGARVHLMNPQAAPPVHQQIPRYVPVPVYVPYPAHHAALPPPVPPAAMLPPLLPAVGEGVWVPWSDGRWRPGIVVQQGAHGQVCVQMPWGHFHWLNAEVLRPRPGR
jgi:hypothetical protein